MKGIKRKSRNREKKRRRLTCVVGRNRPSQLPTPESASPTRAAALTCWVRTTDLCLTLRTPSMSHGGRMSADRKTSPRATHWSVDPHRQVFPSIGAGNRTRARRGQLSSAGIFAWIPRTRLAPPCFKSSSPTSEAPDHLPRPPNPQTV